MQYKYNNICITTEIHNSLESLFNKNASEISLAAPWKRVDPPRLCIDDRPNAVGRDRYETTIAPTWNRVCTDTVLYEYRIMSTVVIAQFCIQWSVILFISILLIYFILKYSSNI